MAGLASTNGTAADFAIIETAERPATGRAGALSESAAVRIAYMSRFDRLIWNADLF
jgi:hypothetical protein